MRSCPVRTLLFLAVLTFSVALACGAIAAEPAAAPAAAKSAVVPVPAPELRDVTPVEKAYVNFALDQKNPAVCAKISPLARETNRFLTTGRQVFFTRSACFMYVAQITLKPEYCSAVKEAPGSFFAKGWYFTQKNCERLVATGRTLQMAFTVDAQLIMKHLGYGEAELNGRSWIQFYQDIRKNQDKSLPDRIKRMLDFTKIQMLMDE